LGAFGAWAQAPGGYSNFADLERKVTTLARQHADVMRVSVAGVSAGGRKIHAIEIAAKGAVPPGQRPAVFVGANIAGYHNAGTEAALTLVEKLVARKTDPLLANRTFYILPAMNPDAHDAIFAKVRQRQHWNGAKLDRDRDGLTGEDGPDDLNGDGRITQMRIPDPHGEYLPDPTDPRLMKKADPLKGEKGAYRVLTEGADNDGDGAFNEDAAGGFAPDKNFAAGWADDDPEAGAFASSTPEAKAAMDYLLARRNVALAFVFGPGNNLLEVPKAGADFGQTRLVLTPAQAGQMGVEPRAYALDELYKLLEGSPVMRQLDGSREALAAVLGAGPAVAVDGEDVRYYQSAADEYKKILEKAGLDAKRPGKGWTGGGLTQWLYLHYSTFVMELDVWGVAKDWKGGAVAWTPVTLPDGTKAEVGGTDPFAAIAPEAAELAKAAGAHVEMVWASAEKLARVEMLSASAQALGGGVWRVTAVAGNTGAWPTHTKHAVRSRAWLPVRLKLTLPAGASLVNGNDQAFSERLTGGTGVLRGEWLVRSAQGAKLTVDVLTQNAGTGRQEVTLP